MAIRQTARIRRAKNDFRLGAYIVLIARRTPFSLGTIIMEERFAEKSVVMNKNNRQPLNHRGP